MCIDLEMNAKWDGEMMNSGKELFMLDGDVELKLFLVLFFS